MTELSLWNISLLSKTRVNHGKSVTNWPILFFLTVTALIAGDEGREEIEDFGSDHLPWLRQYGDFENGIPTHDTIARLMGLLSGRQLQRFFVQWMQTCHERSEGTLVAIDGKMLRVMADKRIKNSAIHMVSAFCAANRVVLGQVKIDDKSNEITAIPELLKLLELKGCLVSIDAMGCQRKIAEQIVKRDADYLLAVKGNQGKLEQAFSDWYSPMMFKCGEERDDHDEHYATQESGHGRKETRLCIASQDLRPLGDLTFEWPNLTMIGIVATISEEGGKPI
ncbi:Predicted transposase YbfD/YdcC associated with H repeats [Aeromonas sp. RU39B]|nr:Predicted transposase YbfD/YdcC associated with H repeats [Aeromonas sp. RU39B]